MNQCPHCLNVGHKHSTNKNGTTRYRCAGCKRTFSESTGRAVGRPMGAEPSKEALKKRRQRASQM